MLRHVPVLEAAPVLVPLEDVMPLQCMLVPVALAQQHLPQVRCPLFRCFLPSFMRQCCCNVTCSVL